MIPLVAMVLGVALAIVVIVLVARSRRTDTVDSVRRGLDALSQEARRPVVDQVQHHVRQEPDADADPNADADPDAPTGPADEPGTDADGDEGGSSGT